MYIFFYIPGTIFGTCEVLINQFWLNKKQVNKKMANVIFPIGFMVATGQYFSKYGPEPSEDLVKDESPKPYLRFTESQSLLVWPRNLQF